MVQWPRFGPYHLARLAAAHRYFAAHGAEVVGMETAGQDATYAWRVEAAETPFRRAQIFPTGRFEDLPPALVHDGVTKMLDRLAPDAVAINSYSLPDARACLAWCRRHRRTAIVMTDSKADDAPRIAWREHLKSLLVRQFDAALLAGTPQRAYFLDLGFPDDAIFLGYDVVDNDFFRKGADEARADPARGAGLPGLADARPFFLASGRFLPRKNFDGLLRAYARYRAEAGTPWRIVLLGDGPERARLEALVRDDGIEGVTFAGFRQIEELPVYYGRAGAFVHPAYNDQWGLVVNEAMAAGLPVLVSERAGCAQDLVRDGENGFRFDPADPAALARLLARLAAPETDRAAMGRRSREIIARWSPERFAEGLHRAAEAGRDRARRGLHPAVAALLHALRLTARSTDSFHTVRDA